MVLTHWEQGNQRKFRKYLPVATHTKQGANMRLNFTQQMKFRALSGVPDSGGNIAGFK